MIANIFVILFLLGMIYWWSSQGFFSAFLHLCVVVFAGAFALAFWEPLAFLLLNNVSGMAQHAWGLALLLPFVISLAVVRIALDKLVPGNVHFVGLVNMIGGGLCGLAAAILTSGMTLIGLGFLPLDADLAGYQPYAVSGSGVVDRNERLWILSVDELTASFYNKLSQGAFATSTPLVSYLPDLAKQSALFRLRYDPNASVVAIPDSVNADAYFHQGTPVPGLNLEIVDLLGNEFQKASNQLVVVDTLWDQKAGTYDGSTLRVPPTQIRLVTEPKNAEMPEPRVYAPVGFAREENPKTGERLYYAVSSDRVYASTTSQQQRFAWTFIVPADEQPQYLQVRRLRLPLPDAQPPEAMATILGEPVKEDDADAEQAQGQPTVGEREGAVVGHLAETLELTNRLPQDISKNDATALSYDGEMIRGGKAQISGRPGNLSQRTRATSIYQPNHLAMVRMKVQQDRAKSLLGAARAAAASLAGVWLEDDRGQKWEPIGYVWVKSGGGQEVFVDLDNRIRSARQLPAREMGAGDELYLYFHIQRGVTLDAYHIGTETQQDVNLRIP